MARFFAAAAGGNAGNGAQQQQQQQAPPPQPGPGKGKGKGWSKRNGYKRWCFTAFGFGQNQCKALKDWPDSGDISFLIIGLEECPHTQRPHIQGYVELAVQQRLNWVKQNPLPNHWHWEPARGTPEENALYCEKDNNYWEWGDRSDQRPKTRSAAAHKARAEHMQRLAEQIRAHRTWAEVMRDDDITWQIASRMTWAKNIYDTKPWKPFYLNVDAPGYQWQGKVARFFLGVDPDDRTIHWFYDPDGDTGKSKFVKFLLATHGAMLIPNDYKSSMSAYHQQKIAVGDVPRDDVWDNYRGLEKIKDGCLTQEKYEVVTKCTGEETHVAVFANHKPLTIRMTFGRWHFIDLSTVTDDTPLEEMFPPERFPGVRTLWANGDPLHRTGPVPKANVPEGNVLMGPLDTAPAEMSALAVLTAGYQPPEHRAAGLQLPAAWLPWGLPDPMPPRQASSRGSTPEDLRDTARVRAVRATPVRSRPVAPPRTPRTTTTTTQSSSSGFWIRTGREAPGSAGTPSTAHEHKKKKNEEETVTESSPEVQEVLSEDE
jgi:hypothetical protein